MDPANTPFSSMDQSTPAELRGVERALSRLASAERAAAPRNLTDRLMSASAGHLARVAPKGGEVQTSDRAVAGVISRWLSPRIRLAAALMLVAGAGIVALSVIGVRWPGTGAVNPPAVLTNAGSSGVSTPSSAAGGSEVDVMLAAVEAVDSWGQSTPVSALIAEVDVLDASLVSQVLDTSLADVDSTSGATQ